MSLTAMLLTLLCCAILTGISIFSFINKPGFFSLLFALVFGTVSYIMLMAIV
ncbi:hypothetical protein COHAPHLL_00004 [Vibrio phage V09]|uniref:Uncharacterized protein n=1 Tax=Vibrio phage V09 TaxID=2724327 RepID=A0A6H0X8Y1_9CAUD|nr:hypothetical protein COHAPHLL_00004 [Vibrio phage V09]